MKSFLGNFYRHLVIIFWSHWGLATAFYFVTKQGSCDVLGNGHCTCLLVWRSKFESDWSYPWGIEPMPHQIVLTSSKYTTCAYLTFIHESKVQNQKPTPASFSFSFGRFNNTNFTTNQCEKVSKCPSSIRRRDSNPRPSEH